MQVLDPSPHNDVAKDGENLISIENPMLHFKAVVAVEIAYLFRNTFRATHYRLHFGHGSPRFSQLVQGDHALAVRLLTDIPELVWREVIHLL